MRTRRPTAAGSRARPPRKTISLHRQPHERRRAHLLEPVRGREHEEHQRRGQHGQHDGADGAPTGDRAWAAVEPQARSLRSADEQELTWTSRDPHVVDGVTRVPGSPGEVGQVRRGTGVLVARAGRGRDPAGRAARAGRRRTWSCGPCGPAVSRGTETLVFGGHVPPSQYDVMRAPFQDGDFPGPVKYGYLSVGVVEDGAPRAPRPHGLLPAPAPDGVRRAGVGGHRRARRTCRSRRAVLAGIVETAVNALWDAPPLLGDRVAVVGAGTVGCCVARLLARVPGRRRHARRRRPRARRGGGRRSGWTSRCPTRSTAAATWSSTPARPRPACSASLELLAPEGTVVELSWYGDATTPLALGRQLPLRSARRSGPARSARSRRRGAVVVRRRTGSRSRSSCCATRRSTPAHRGVAVRDAAGGDAAAGLRASCRRCATR